MITKRKFQMLVLVFVPVLLLVATFLLFTIEAPKEEVAEVEIITIEEPFVRQDIIGTSVQGRDIDVVTFGNGSTHVLFVGGIHGGYEWNSSLLAYGIIEEITENPHMVPDDLMVSIIPVLNPDGLYKVIGKEGLFTLEDVPNPSVRVAAGRFNANEVDLNRNFDCKWAPESTWRGKVISAGSSVFSEPEAQALRDFVHQEQPSAVVFWHSKAGNVYASECKDGILPETLILMKTYADAAGYGKVEVFDAYPITGDAEAWLASIGIPAVTVELQTAHLTEWDRNLAGINAVIQLYSQIE